jgi:hypothetical protein
MKWIRTMKIEAKTTEYGVGMNNMDTSDINLQGLVQSFNLRSSFIHTKGKPPIEGAKKTFEAKHFIAAHQALISDLKNQIKESTDQTNVALYLLFKDHNKIVDSCQEQIILSSSLINCYDKVSKHSKSPSTEMTSLLNSLISVSISAFKDCKQYFKNT